MGSDVPTGRGASLLFMAPRAGLTPSWVETLYTNGHLVTHVQTLDAALNELAREFFHVLVIDLDSLRTEGSSSIRRILGAAPSSELVIIYDRQDADILGEAVQIGNFDFLGKPVEPKLLSALISRSVHQSHLRRELKHLRRSDQLRAGEMIGRSPGLRHVLSLIEELAPTDSTVLIRGETGTGKELVARALHRSSARAHLPFIVANCAAIPHELMESEMFGHVRGAFTNAISDHEGFFEAAGNGTLLLDEIGDLDVALQAKILRVLEDGGFRRVGSNRSLQNHARVLASTNQPLEELIEEGRFREDLYYRLSVPIHVPPLRERKEDIPLLTEYFMDRFCRGRRRGVPRFDTDAMEAMTDHPWRGNIRELRNCVQQVSIRASGSRVRLADVRPLLLDRSFLPAPGSVQSIREMERNAIEHALAHFHGNVTRTAGALGIGRRTLQNKMQRYGLSPRAKD